MPSYSYESNEWKVVCGCDKKDCLSCWTQKVETEFYRWLENDEITTEEKYEEVADDYFHQELDESVQYEDNYTVDTLLADYGIHKAFLLYFEKYGDMLHVNEEANISRRLLYVVCYEIAHPAWEAYKEYLNKDKDEDECDTHTDNMPK